MFFWFFTGTKGRILSSMVLLLIFVFVFVSSGVLAQENSKYQYTYKGQSVGMSPSDNLVVVEQTRTTKGIGVLQTFADFDLTLDSLNEKLPKQNSTMSILRFPSKNRNIKGISVLRDQVKRQAEQGAYIYQPVFEQGQAIFIPTAEVLVGFKNVTDTAEAKAYLTNSARDLGIVDIRSGGKDLFIITINNPGDGRCYEVSRQLSDMSGIDFAEPNHLIIHLDPVDTSTHLLDERVQNLHVDSMAGSSTKNAGASLVPQTVMADLASNWKVVASVNGEETHFPATGWEILKKNGAAQVLWGITDYRRHSGKNSIYCSGAGSEGVAAPGPAPININTTLVSPLLDLSSYEEAYVEVWFFAKNQFVRNDKGAVVSGDYPVLVITDGQETSLVPLFVRYIEDATIDPTTSNGWRKLLYRISPSLRAKPVKILFAYVSDSVKQVEGAYLDDIRVIASTKVARGNIQNDPYSGRQYELRNTGQVAGQGNENNDMNVVDAWREVDVSPKVIVAVIDDGVDLNHPDLNIVGGFNPDGSAGGGPVSERANHGTSVAGNIGAIGKNGIGVIGTAPNVKIISVNRGRSTAADYANAIDTAVKKGAHILNNSWGFNGVSHRVIELAVLRALAAGRIVLAAAGNGPDRAPFNYNVYFPGNMTGSTDVITVGASSLTDEHKSASSSDGQFTWGSSFKGDGPDICAPGPWSYTTDKLGKLGYNDGSSGIHPDYHHSFGGTSASTPKVAGIVALMLSANMDLTPAQVKRILRESADDIDEAGFDDKTGGGRVNALRAVQMARALKQSDIGVPVKKVEKLPKQNDPPPPQDDNGYQKVLDW